MSRHRSACGCNDARYSRILERQAHEWPAWACIHCRKCRFQNLTLDFAQVFDCQLGRTTPKRHAKKINMIETAKSAIRHFRHRLHAEARKERNKSPPSATSDLKMARSFATAASGIVSP